MLLTRSAWFYDYDAGNPYIDNPEAKGQCEGHDTELDRKFVPMNWCTSKMNQTVPPGVNRTFFMGFNVPNNHHQCDRSPHDVAAAWGTVMEMWPDSKLVSPATSGNGTAWYEWRIFW